MTKTPNTDGEEEEVRYQKAFRLLIFIDNEKEFSYKGLRERIEKAVEDAGAEMSGFNFIGSPDPYLFDDPDDMPKGVK